MRDSFPASGFMGNNFDGVWQAVEDFKSRFEKRAGSRAGRGELRTAILALLADLVVGDHLDDGGQVGAGGAAKTETHLAVLWQYGGAGLGR